MPSLILNTGNARAGVGDSAFQKPRAGKTGELMVARSLGSYAEAVMRGNVFAVQVGVAGVAPGTAISTTPPLTLWNPPNSGVLVVVYRHVFAYISGTIGAGEMIYLQNAQTAAPTTGTEKVPVNCLLGNGTRSKARAFSGSTVAATPTIIASTGIILGAFLGGAGNILPPIDDAVDGALILYPGNCLSSQDHVNNAGSTPLVDLGFIWEEAPLT
jgi:hypothetical protein